VVNADDFGFARDVNRGIVEAHGNGILTATTLMANGREFSDAVRLAREHPSLDIGVHLVLVQGESVLPGGAALPATLSQLLAAVSLGRIRIYEELRAQVERIVDAGIRPSHLDTHKHTHLLPPVLDAVCRLAEEFDVRWVRRPIDLPLEGTGRVPWGKRALSRGLGGLRGHFHRKLEQYGCRTTDHFAGFAFTGYLQEEQALEVLRGLPPGSTEFMCHPGFCTSELRGMPTRLKESREAELRALTSPAVRDALEAASIELVSYRSLMAAVQNDEAFR
jgi:chitin disaccharide deacetylase